MNLSTIKLIEICRILPPPYPSLGNIVEQADYVIETWRDGTEWYRLYKSGWCEQGGRQSVANDGTLVVTLHKPYIDTNYYVNWISCSGARADGAGTRAADTLTTTSFRLYNGQDSTMTANWMACGMTI